MKHYSLKQINEIKQEIRTGKPVAIIADELAKQWKRPVNGVYAKVLKLSKMTRRVVGNYNGPSRKPHKPKVKPAIVDKELNFTPMPGSLMDKFDSIIDEPIQEPSKIEQQPAEIGIEVPTSNIAFTGIPSRVVIYSDHVRYYFDK
jgi:hypothetical protein